MGVDDHDTFSGLTPLQQAAADGNLEKLIELMDAGADVNIQANGEVRPDDPKLSESHPATPHLREIRAYRRLTPRPIRARGPTASIAFAPPFSPAPLADLDGSRRSGEQPRGRFRRSIRRNRSVTDLLTICAFIRCPARPPP